MTLSQSSSGMTNKEETSSDKGNITALQELAQLKQELAFQREEAGRQKIEMAQVRELLQGLTARATIKSRTASTATTQNTRRNLNKPRIGKEASSSLLMGGFNAIIDVDDMVLHTCNESSSTESVEDDDLYLPDKEKNRGGSSVTDGVKSISNITNPDDDDGWHSPFSESTYTLFYVCDVNSQAFWYAMLVYSLQIVTIVLTLVDIIDISNEGNVLQIQPMVSIIVTCSQAVTLFMALAYQSDLIEAVLKLHDGFYHEVLEEYPGATRETWLFSCMAQLFAGLLLLTTIFVLTMQSEDVLSIMLNFAALHFMAEVDDLGFSIAKMGFITNQLQRQAEAVGDFKVPKRDRGNNLRRVLYFLALGSLFVGYGWLKAKQIRGDYLQTYLYVQFGDSYKVEMPYYSGLLKSDDYWTAGHRRYRDVQTREILLAYCDSDNAWTFSDTDDPCDFFAQSPPTRTYDVTSIPGDRWVIKDRINRVVPFIAFTLLGRDCDTEICQGECVDGVCVCQKDQFGMDCEFTDICPELSINEMFDAFPKRSDGGWSVSKVFKQLLDPVTGDPLRVYSMPVYYSNSTFPANVIFFGGRRWILTSESDLLGDLWLNSTQLHMPNSTTELFLSGSFHAHQSEYNPWFMSDPLDFQSSDFQPTPIGLWWYSTYFLNATDLEEAHAEEGYQLDVVLECHSCLAELGGYCDPSGGKCSVTTGQCECKEEYGYSGSRCDIQMACYEQEIPCGGTENGICDEVSGICRCEDHSYGKLCQTDFYCFEDSGECQNGGLCDAEITAFCQCVDPSTSGIACQVVDDCTSYGCLNGGICNNDTKACVCEQPYEGFGCGLVNGIVPDIFCATHEDCKEEFICEDYSGSRRCACNGTLAYGTHCQHQYNFKGDGSLRDSHNI